MISSATYPNQLVASSSVLDSDSDSYAESLEDYDLDLSDAHPLMPIAPDTTQIQTLPQESLLLYNINPNLFRALCLSPDVRFLSMSSEEQSSCFRSLEIRRYNPGSTIIAEGDSSTDMFLVITEGKGFEAEVVRRAGEMRERMITCLRAGQLFGERFFISRKAVLRNATVRAAVSCSGELEVAVLSPEHFKHWDRLRHFLLIKKVPLFAALKQNERQQLFNDVSCKVYEDGELIIRQGDAGVEFFVVVEGNVVVFENGDTSSRRVLCSLHSGHFFGEMALLTNEPRVASVVADGKVMCLCVAQSAFQAICSNDLFSDVMRRILVDRQKARRLRPSPRGMNKKAKSISALPSHTAHTVVQDRRFSSAYEMRSPSSNVCHASRQLVEGAEYIGGYRMLSRLGRGVHGRVFLCEEAASGKRFAMKEVKGHKAAWTAAQSQRTGANLREAEILRSLSHRRVVALLDVLQVDGAGCSVYLVLELLVGPLMSEEAQTEHIPEGDCRRHFRDMVDGLAHIHSCGIVHRDLKPSNMLLDQLGNVKISDFGSAVYLSDAEQRCISGGTPAFMAPELFGSESTALASTASDLFGLGATLYCILVGSPPWLGRSQLDHAGKLIKFELEFPSSEIPTPHVRHLLSRMLEKEPTERIGLNDVMVHDWVTAEGLEPLLGEEGRDDSLQALSDEEIRQLF